MENNNINYNWEECFIMIDISMIKETITFNKLQKDLYKNYSKESVDKILNILLQNSAIQKEANYVYIRQKQIRDILDEQLFINKVYNWMQEFHICHW